MTDWSQTQNTTRPKIETPHIIKPKTTIPTMAASNKPSTKKMEKQYGERHNEHNLRPRRPRDYGHLHAILEHTVMTQYTINKGLKVIGDAGTEALLSELQQLHHRKAV
jgi:hypothetical protein